MDAAAIVHAVVAIGRVPRLKIVAEGIETEAQERFVSAAGCAPASGLPLWPRHAGERSVTALGTSSAGRVMARRVAQRWSKPE